MLKEKGVGKETQALQKKRNEIRERLRVAAFGDNVYFISRQIIYCLDRLNGGLRWTHRLGFVPSARPFAIRNFVFVPSVDTARVWVLDVEKKGQEIASYRASIMTKENQIMNQPIYSDPSLYFSCHDGNVYCFKVTGEGGGEWTVDCTADPPACTRGDTGKAQCTIEVAADDFKTMLSDPNAGMQLYFQGKLRVTGDPMLATKLQKLFQLNG